MIVKNKAAAVVLGTVVALAAGGTAVAAHHSSDTPKAGNVVHACVTPKHVTLIGRACHVNETRVAWNKRGRRGLTGPQGPQGVQGPEGPQGPQGPAGLANIHQSAGYPLSIASGQFAPIAATCVVGQAIGGAWVNGAPGALVIPTESQVKDGNTWQFTFYNATGVQRDLTVYAVCAG